MKPLPPGCTYVVSRPNGFGTLAALRCLGYSQRSRGLVPDCLARYARWGRLTYFPDSIWECLERTAKGPRAIRAHHAGAEASARQKSLRAAKKLDALLWRPEPRADG